MRTGPQKYPGASTAYWYQSRYPGSAMESNVVVWHSTEGTSLPAYDGGANAPNLTAVPDFSAKRLRWYQHFDIDVSSRALVNRAGGVDTNTLNVIQVEVVGTCDPDTHRRWGTRPHLYMPELPDWAVRDLAAFALWVNRNHNVPLSSGLTFRAYPSSYGATSVRMSGTQWRSFKGHCGHQHVPENDHGDPGAFPMSEILAVAKGEAVNDSNGSGTMALELADVKKIWNTDGFITVPWGTETNQEWAPASILRHGVEVSRENRDRIKDLQAQVTALVGRVEANNAAISELAKAVAAQSADIDADALVSRITEAIENVTVRLDVAEF